MKGNFLALFGHVAIDVTLNVDFLPTKGSVAVNSLKENFGGTAGNFALIGARLGLPFHLFSAVSDRSHSNYIKFLKEIGADISHLYVDNQDMGPIGYAASNGTDQIYYFYQGPMGKPLESRISLDPSGYQWVHFGTGLPDDYLSISKKCDGSRIVFDPGQEINYRYDKDNLERMLEIAHLSIMNEAEVARAEEILGVGQGELPDYCSDLIVTRGKNGSSYFKDGNRKDFSARMVSNPYDTIGAGDAFRAGMYYAIWRNMPMDKAIELGSAVSAEAIKRPFKEFCMSGDQMFKQISQ